MALTNGSITDVRSCMNSIKSTYTKIEEDLASFNYVMKNQDFLTFAEKTKFGADVQEKMNKLIVKLQRLGEEIEKLKNSTELYLKNQEALNDQSY